MVSSSKDSGFMIFIDAAEPIGASQEQAMGLWPFLLTELRTIFV